MQFLKNHFFFVSFRIQGKEKQEINFNNGNMKDQKVKVS